ncbi:uncharacterized protein LOC125083819 isoform X7 [Lutra lutra]|uniref:uncharacterized protein LOC125083819 isoform X7 n=1 Tax=Lutra lutra TaxID=9657 RepID=UPI001FD1AA97|nr:uncharacterized protein LOC125083819 isoform X7 [Lutra lutra]
MKRPTILNRILDSPDTQPPEEDRIQGSQECAGTGSSVEVLPALEPKPGPAWPAALPQQMTPGPQLSGASGRALAGRLQHEDVHRHAFLLPKALLRLRADYRLNLTYTPLDCTLDRKCHEELALAAL